jgi:hypothetical protein
MVDSYFTCGISSSIKRNLERRSVSRVVDASRFPMAELVIMLTGASLHMHADFRTSTGACLDKYRGG